MNLTEIVKGIAPVDREWTAKARERTAQLVMPTRALGRLHEISEQLLASTQEPDSLVLGVAASVVGRTRQPSSRSGC